MAFGPGASTNVNDKAACLIEKTGGGENWKIVLCEWNRVGGEEHFYVLLKLLIIALIAI